jgi:alpha-1,6-mannosyltransferase
VVGDGPLRRRLERSARGLPVTFVGHLTDRRAVARILASADIALVPDPSDRFSRSILEALASGTAVVAGDSITAANLLANGSGAVSGSSVPEFAGAVQNLLALPVEDRRADARDAAARFPWAQTVATMLAIHESSDAVSGWSELAPISHFSA